MYRQICQINHYIADRVIYHFIPSYPKSGGDMSRLMDEAMKLVGSRISIKHDDYGTVTEVVSVIKNDVTYVVVVTDKGKRVEARSLLANLTSSTKGKVYPDGTAYSKRFAGPKAAYKAMPAFVANINNTAKIGIHSVNLTSHLSSHDNCDEDNVRTQEKGK